VRQETAVQKASGAPIRLTSSRAWQIVILAHAYVCAKAPSLVISARPAHYGPLAGPDAANDLGSQFNLALLINEAPDHTVIARFALKT
jgi:hypothetical protein